MKSATFAALASICLALFAAPASASAADLSGTWRVAGKIASFAFALRCEFKPEGMHLGGHCIDNPHNDPNQTGGKRHPLAGVVDGDKVNFAYKTTFLLAKFDVALDGVQMGDQINGKINVEGHEGEFTATRE